MGNKVQFKAKIISGNRITIRKEDMDDLGVKEGDKVRVEIETIDKDLRGLVI